MRRGSTFHDNDCSHFEGRGFSRVWKCSYRSSRQTGQRRLTFSHCRAHSLWKMWPHGNRLIGSSEWWWQYQRDSPTCRRCTVVWTCPSSCSWWVCGIGAVSRWSRSRCARSRSPAKVSIWRSGLLGPAQLWPIHRIIATAGKVSTWSMLYLLLINLHF